MIKIPELEKLSEEEEKIKPESERLKGD